LFSRIEKLGKCRKKVKQLTERHRDKSGIPQNSGFWMIKKNIIMFLQQYSTLCFLPVEKKMQINEITVVVCLRPMSNKNKRLMLLDLRYAMYSSLE
jgi:hypothetical protein